MAASPGWPAESGRAPRRGSRSPDPFHHICCVRSARRSGEEPVSQSIEPSARRTQPTVLKFGGTSVADALLTAVDAAATGTGDPKRPRPELDALIERHQAIATRLARPQGAAGL